MQIRRLLPDDDATVVADAGRVVEEAYFALADYPYDDAYDSQLREVATRAESADVVVAIVDGRVASCLTFVPGVDNPYSDHDDADAASFRMFGVDPSMAGRGIGEAMVRWCIDEARRLGRRRLRIHTLTAMQGAQRLYSRLGFVRDPAFDADFDGIPGLAYRLDL